MAEHPAHDSDRPPASVATPTEPPAPAHEGTHIDDGWRPRNDDDGPRAVAYRARYGHNGVKSLRVEIASLANSVGGLTKAVEAVKKLLLWAMAILGAASVIEAGRLFWAWLSTLHH